MTTPAPSEIDRKRFGDLADDVAYLRGCGLAVAPFHDGFRIGGEVLGEDGVRARAEQERDRRAGRALAQAAKTSNESGGGGKSRIAAKAGNTPGAAPGAEESQRATGLVRAEVRGPATVAHAGVASGPFDTLSGGSDAPSVENAREERSGGQNGRGSPAQQDPPAVADIGERPRVLWLDLGLLTVDTRYQRDISRAGLTHINRIAREWHWSRYQPIVVNEREDGTFAVIDGQHRLEAARKNKLVTELPCYIVAAPSVAAEAAIFGASNTRRLGLTPHQKFWAAKVSDDPAAVAVHEIATRLGVKILRGNPSGTIPPMCVNSPLALQRTLARFGKAGLSISLGLIAETHADTPSAFRSSLIVALASIAASREFSRERMKRTLAALDLDQLYEDARLDRITAKGTLETATERVLRWAYEAAR